MTQKELNYLEDAIGHEDNIIKICTENVNNMHDEDLKNFMHAQIEKHKSLKEKLMNMLEEKTNE